mgnify:CR=1 FL=1
MRKSALFTVAITLTITSFSQSKWSLRDCLEYAIKNNISIQQADIQTKFEKLNYEQSKLALYPNFNSQHSTGYQFGRSIDPTSNQFTTSEILFANHGLDMNMDLFNWFSKRNTIAAKNFTFQANVEKYEKAKNDIALAIVNAYLMALLNNEQTHVAEVQLSQTKEQLSFIEKQVNVGKLPELNLTEMQTQLANDSNNVIATQSNYNVSLLRLKTLMSLDVSTPFQIDATEMQKNLTAYDLTQLSPDNIYNIAISHLPQQKINDLNLKSAKAGVLIAKAAMYPRLSLFGGLSSRYSNAQKFIPNAFQSAIVPIGIVNVDGNNHIVTNSVSQPVGFDKNTYFRQLSNNFSQSIGVSLSIPIFNGGMARTNWEKAKLNVSSAELLKKQDNQALKEEIFELYENAAAALKKYYNSVSGEEAAQKSYDFSRKRFDVGAIKPLDMIITQNNLLRTKINKLTAQYDFLFRLKLLQFYNGQKLYE